MTPTTQLGIPQQDSTGLNNYNTLSNNTPPAATPSVQNTTPSPSDNLMSQFATPFQMFSTLIENYPAALNEGRAALQSLYSWLDKAVTSLNSGAETTTPNSSQQTGIQANNSVGY